MSKETKVGKDFGVESAHLAAPPVKVAIIASVCFACAFICASVCSRFNLRLLLQQFHEFFSLAHLR